MLTQKRIVKKLLLSLLSLGVVAGILLSCSNLSGDTGGGTATGAQFNGKGARVYVSLPGQGRSARSAVPSKFKDSGGDELVFAGAIVASGAPTAADLKAVTYDSSDNSIIIPFDIKAADTECGLHIYAFPSGTTATGADPSIALLHGTKTITIPGGATSLNIEDAISLEPVSGATATGSVSLAVTIPTGCALTCDSSGFSYDSPTEKIIATNIAKGKHTVNFTVTKGGQTVYAWTETIYVYPGMVTDAWNTGSDGTTERVISAAQMYSTFYVRGSGGSWITGITSEAGNDIYGDGSLAKPYATVQKAVDKVKAINDGNTEYTIYVDGTVTGVTDISDTGTLKLLVIGLGTGSDIATLDGNSAGSVVKLEGENLNFTFENLKFTGGNATSGGGIYVASGNVKLNDCIVNGNTATGTGGGICTFGKLEISGGTISGNTADTNGGGIYIAGSGNPNSSLTIDGCTIGGDTSAEANHADNRGGGIYKGSGGSLNIKGDTIIKGNIATNDGGGIYNSGGTKISGGEISGNTVTSSGIKGNGIYTSGAFNMSGSIEIAQNNNVFIRSGAIITVDGELTKPVAAYISVVEAKYKPGTQVLQADGTKVTELTDDICKKFILLDATDLTNVSATLEIVLDTTDSKNGVLADVATKQKTVYLNSASGNDSNNGATSDTPVKTLKQAFEVLDTSDDTGKIVIMNPYTLKITNDENDESELLNRAGETKVTIERYYTTSSYCRSDLITINPSATATIKISNITMDGNWKSSSGTSQITNANGSLLYINGSNTTVTLENAILKNNITANTSKLGSAIYSESATINIKTGCEIIGNQGYGGGGIYNHNGTINITGGKIIENNASSDYGGGIYCAGCNLTIEDGTISDNTADRGGGIYISSGSIATISGGTLKGNSASRGNGIFNGGTLNMLGNAQIDQDNDVYLSSTYITITGNLNKTNVARVTPSFYSALNGTQVLAGDTDLILNNYNKFIATPDGSTIYFVDSDGKMKKAP